MNQYGVIVADPPWNYNQTSTSEKLSGYSDKEYEPLTTEDLCALGTDIRQLASSDSLLFLWTTWPFIADALHIIDAWGFKYITGLPWVKMDSYLKHPTYGVGYWFRGCTELILVAKRGKSHRGNRKGILNFESPRNTWAKKHNNQLSLVDEQVGWVSVPEGHSKKPDALQEIIEKDYPGPYLEIFGRRAREGWTVLGDEAPEDGTDIRVSLHQLTTSIEKTLHS